jgi:hypothetical protein
MLRLLWVIKIEFLKDLPRNYHDSRSCYVIEESPWNEKVSQRAPIFDKAFRDACSGFF